MADTDALGDAMHVQQSDKVSDVLAFVAHELRNPLHAMMLQLAVAKATAEAHGHDETLARIGKVQASMSRYANRVTLLLELACVDNGSLHASVKDVDVAELLQLMVDASGAEARSRGLVLTYEGPNHGVAWVDPVLFEQIIENLVLNAFKHSQGSRVTVKLQAPESDGTVRVEVADDGRGISEADQQRIFGKHSVVHYAGRVEGKGLGLWIVSKLVEAMNGRIELTSAPGAGTVFSVFFKSPGAEDLP